MPLFLISILLGGGWLLLKNKTLGTSTTNTWGIADVTPSTQGGDFDTTYDAEFAEAASDWGVPFALLKAHSIQESSLNPNAFLDESNGRSDRPGWASRGLMQVLWWPGSNRFVQYGYTDDFVGDGSILFSPHINVQIGAQIVKGNLKATSGSIRDAINMYNTGKTESAYEAPGNYVDKVLGYYNTLIGS